MTLQSQENDTIKSEVQKVLGSELRKSFDGVVTSRVPERMKDLLQRLDQLEQSRLLKARQWL
jgi:hypothetical protein